MSIQEIITQELTVLLSQLQTNDKTKQYQLNANSNGGKIEDITPQNQDQQAAQTKQQLVGNIKQWVVAKGIDKQLNQQKLNQVTQYVETQLKDQNNPIYQSSDKKVNNLVDQCIERITNKITDFYISQINQNIKL